MTNTGNLLTSARPCFQRVLPGEISFTFHMSVREAFLIRVDMLKFTMTDLSLAVLWARFQIKKTRTDCAFLPHRATFNSRILYLTLAEILLVVQLIMRFCPVIEVWQHLVRNAHARCGAPCSIHGSYYQKNLSDVTLA